MTKSLSDINMRGNIESLFNISLMIIFCGNGAETVSAKIIWFSLTLLIQTVNSQFEMWHKIVFSLSNFKNGLTKDKFP